MREQEHEVEGIGNSLRFYIRARMAADDAFPFGPGDRFKAIIVDGVVIIAPPERVPDRIEIPTTLQS